jgi:hypothetical protein
VGAEPAGELADASDRLVAALADDIGAVADDRDRIAARDPDRDGGVVAGPHHVGHGQQRRRGRLVLADRQHDEGAVCLRYAHGFTLAAVDVAETVAAAVQACALQPLLAEDAAAVRPQERRDDEIAGLDRPHLVADGLDDADELVAHAAAGVGRLHRLVGLEVAAADPGAGDANQRVGRLDQVGVWDVLDTNIAGAVHERGSHGRYLWLWSVEWADSVESIVAARCLFLKRTTEASEPWSRRSQLARCQLGRARPMR